MPLFIEPNILYSRNSKTFYLQIVKAKRIDRYFYRLYHWYDMKIPIRIPGWGRFEKWVHVKFDAWPNDLAFGDETGRVKDRWVDRLAGWTIHQDFRCYHLGSKCEHVGQVEISEEQYNQFKSLGLFK